MNSLFEVVNSLSAHTHINIVSIEGVTYGNVRVYAIEWEGGINTYIVKIQLLGRMINVCIRAK